MENPSQKGLNTKQKQKQKPHIVKPRGSSPCAVRCLKDVLKKEAPFALSDGGTLAFFPPGQKVAAAEPAITSTHSLFRSRTVSPSLTVFVKGEKFSRYPCCSPAFFQPSCTISHPTLTRRDTLSPACCARARGGGSSGSSSFPSPQLPSLSPPFLN